MGFLIPEEYREAYLTIAVARIAERRGDYWLAEPLGWRRIFGHWVRFKVRA